MNCSEEELTKTNVFQLNILIPLIEILDVYVTLKEEFSPDEFCIHLFVKERPKDKCKPYFNPVRKRFNNVEEFKGLSVSVRSIVIDLFMNIVRYTAFLEPISKDYLDKQNCRNYNDLHQITVFVYILSYRICSLFFEDSVECFVYFKVRRLLSLVAYLLRAETPNLFHEKGCLTFEEDFVEQNLVLPFLEATPCLEKLQEHLKEFARNTKVPKKKLTIPVFMNVLNRPKIRLKVPPATPEDLSVMKFARQVPKTNYLKPSMVSKLESLRATNRTNALNLLKHANKNAPSCFQRRKDVDKSIEREKPRAIVARRSIPKFKPVEIKQTVASTLRECARVISVEEKEIKRLKALAEGGLDPASILKFEEEKRQRQREEELLRIQEKHLLALLTRENAFTAKQSLLDDVKAHAESVRKERQQLYDKLEKWRENHNKEMMEIVEKCHEIEQASREAFNAMIDEKKQKGAEVSEESRRLKTQLMKQREEETQRKIKLIQEIKTIQSLRALPFKDFDPTESSGLGLLCEMSLAELKERLFWTKMKLDEEIKNRKFVIQRERERQKNLINDTRKALEKYKASKCAVSSWESRQQSQVTSPEIDALRKKLEEQKGMRLQKKMMSSSK
ncbi:hypothetical protein QLX08_000377 [Tetragonisca angustula]|uniref:Cilia- and flagella-associated protein 99 n=1 Tax=Tetragonisca angustula TaxID=166442 RepID=A0AAW1AMM7_9HYME